MEGKNMAHRTRQNCLGYVLNIYDHHGNTAQLFPRTFQLENPNIFKCLAEKFNELGYELQQMSKNVPIRTSQDQIILAFWGLFPIVEKCLWWKKYIYDFHFARLENDGSWAHKMGWNVFPERSSIEELNFIYDFEAKFLLICKKDG